MLKIAALVAVGILSAAPSRAQGIVSAYPPLSPAEAVAILRSSHSPVDRTDLFVDRMPMEATPPVLRGDWAPRPAPARVAVPRRLDGTLLSQPPWEMHAYVGSSHGHGSRRGRR